MSELVPQSGAPGAQLTLTGDQIPFGAYQAIYHKLTKRVERDRKFYFGAFEISFGDIENLHTRLMQSIRQYQVKAQRCEITHAVKNESTRYHSSFEKFKILGTTSSSCTQRLSYSFDFLVILPPEVKEANEIAQRYKLTLVIDQEMLETPTSLPYLFIRDPDLNNLMLNIEYADYAVFQHLRAVVDEWVGGLGKREPSTFLKSARASEKHIRPFLDISIFSAGLYGAYQYLAPPGPVTTETALQVVILGFIFGFSGSSLAEYFLSLTSRFLVRLYPITYLNFTTGDQDRKDGQEKSRRRARVFISLTLSGILLTALVNIFSNYVYDELTSRSESVRPNE